MSGGMQDVVRESLRRKTSDTTGKGIERAQDILVAARQAFALGGYAALSMRGVAARMGATLGSVQHYYRTKDEMLEAMLVHSSNEYQESVNRILASMPAAPRGERFLAAITYLISETRTPVTRGLLIESLALAGRHTFAAEVCEQMIARARRAIRRLIRELGQNLGKKDLDERAALILAVILGLLFSPAGERHEDDSLDQAAQQAMLAIATKQELPRIPVRRASATRSS